MADVIAVIPARGGSKGIPAKNSRLLLGIPLIAWAIRVARKAQRITRVVVSTDSDALAEIACSEGASLIRRPLELAGDVVPAIPVIAHCLDAIQADDNDIVVLCEPTSPFRSGAIIDECVGKLAAGDCRSVVTVTQLERNPYNIFRVEGDHAVRFIQEPSGSYLQRQQWSNLKRINGCVYTTHAATVKRGLLIDAPLRVVEMSGAESVNIDEATDLALAELLAPNFAHLIA